MKPLVKICGLTRPEDAELAASLGATHVGAVLAPSSPRRLSVQQAKSVFGVAGAKRVLVFKDVPIEDVVRDAEAAGADFVQLYSASEDDVHRVTAEGLGVLRVYDVSESTSALPRFSLPPTERTPALLDVGGGGSGRRFDWNVLGGTAPTFTFIAGGIQPGNVEEILAHRPYGIDLSSGVESAPGVKDPEKLRALFERIESFIRGKT